MPDARCWMLERFVSFVYGVKSIVDQVENHAGGLERRDRRFSPLRQPVGAEPLAVAARRHVPTHAATSGITLVAAAAHAEGQRDHRNARFHQSPRLQQTGGVIGAVAGADGLRLAADVERVGGRAPDVPIAVGRSDDQDRARIHREVDSAERGARRGARERDAP